MKLDSSAKIPAFQVPSWRDQILREFTPQVARLTLVADPDGLLLDEGILQGIRERGFELIPFDDHVAFRYAYESKFRSRWDRGEHTDLVVVLRSSANDLNTLPFDLLEAGRKLSFNLGDLFPKLSYPVVASLDTNDLDALYDAQVRHKPGTLGDNATKEFTLRHVFEIAPELIKKPSYLLRVLLRRHYRGQRIPPFLDERFIQLLRQSGLFDNWPLDQIIPDREAFFAFLQERWPRFLERVATADASKAREDETPYGLEFDGPTDLPFDHDDVRVYIDNLFVEGILKPVTHENPASLSKHWAAVGIRIDPSEDRNRRVDGLLKTLEETLPTENSKHQDWLSLAYRWAELSVLCCGNRPDMPQQTVDRFVNLRGGIDSTFLQWLRSRYAGLHNQPPVPPVMVHHVPQAMARRLSQSRQTRIALIIVDGLALDQWIILREVLKTQQPLYRFREKAVFAWLPTLTSVSRQAAFAGKAPLYFPTSINTNDKEPKQWAQFWAERGLSQSEIAYQRTVGEDTVGELEETISHAKVRVVGLVVDKVDKIMHGMELGTPGMHNQVEQWGAQGFLHRLLGLLLEKRFEVSICSDHGNIEATGCGSPAEGVVADLRGQRVRVYPDQTLRASVKEHFPDAIEWPAYGLPDDYLPLLAPGRKAFIKEGKKTVGHGGSALEELVVPLIYVERRDG
ncbi:MAG TPA: BREX-3 system phosphatase PglZ [Anaerolineales bacterium]|nr:BREX-3 system phosphatase PglZ [Anaerolineales bacterium]